MSTIEGKPEIKFYASGNFATEDEAKAAFDASIEEGGWFKSYHEVWGYYMQPKRNSELKRPRIDRLLVPTKKLLKAGWKLGVAGVEIKASGKDVGPIVNQALDYEGAEWIIGEGEDIEGFIFGCQWLFVFHLDEMKGDLASIMANERIGCAHLRGRRMKFMCGSTNAVTWTDSENVEVKQINCGYKTGSR